MLVYQRLFDLVSRFKTHQRDIIDKQILREDIEIFIDQFLNIGDKWYGIDIKIEIKFKNIKRNKINFDIIYFKDQIINVKRFSLILLDNGEVVFKEKKEFKSEMRKEFSNTILNYYSTLLYREAIGIWSITIDGASAISNK